MTEHKIEISGKRIRNKHTHYEVRPYVGPNQAIITLRGDILDKFQQKYGKSMQDYNKLKITVDLHRNSERVKECQDAYSPPSQLMGSVHSIDDIAIIEKDKK
ncbi:hypothetical protein HOK51_06405 [Candidatus Woesearchaeota archaeon]|jgi:hypothetical protein|nr:hypothetical protein [Candidatus Woesearchaeota archaeon]MBT6519455.1 hypothetical protein [Candidatus Woesearchaeota archaeon]MBT7368883.1 hypothetical protein [Candidatus Woesearchaeota archaeon]